MKIYEEIGELGGTYIKAEREAAEAETAEETTKEATVITTENKRADPAEYGCLSINSNMIVIPKGTTYRFDLSLVYPGAKWLKAAKRNPTFPFQYNDRVFFGIKKYPDDSNYIFKDEFIVGANDNVSTYKMRSKIDKQGHFAIEIQSDETDIEPGIYYYSVSAKFVSTRDISKNSKSLYLDGDKGYFEIIPPTPFRIRNVMIKEADFESA